MAAGRVGAGPAVIRDCSKSEKHYWDEAMLIPELTDRDRAAQVAARFVELRGEGFVIRRFEALQPVEWRTWWVDGTCVMLTAHPDTLSELPDDELDLDEITSGVQSLNLRFVSVDLARSADNGRLRIVEIGDGQVSDRPSRCDPTRFISAITETKHG